VEKLLVEKADASLCPRSHESHLPSRLSVDHGGEAISRLSKHPAGWQADLFVIQTWKDPKVMLPMAPHLFFSEGCFDFLRSPALCAEGFFKQRSGKSKDGQHNKQDFSISCLLKRQLSSSVLRQF